MDPPPLRFLRFEEEKKAKGRRANAVAHSRAGARKVVARDVAHVLGPVRVFAERERVF